MAEFVQTMRDWCRMCQHMEKMGGDRSCVICPLSGCNAIYEEDGSTDYANVEERVAAWAAEHPEPVYPTWYEYLTDMYPAAWNMIKDKPIPADIAQKLGIELKEG